MTNVQLTAAELEAQIEEVPSSEPVRVRAELDSFEEDGRTTYVVSTHWLHPLLPGLGRGPVVWLSNRSVARRLVTCIEMNAAYADVRIVRRRSTGKLEVAARALVSARYANSDLNNLGY